MKYKSSAWRELLQDALSELNSENLPEKIARAEMAVCQRIKQAKAKPGTKIEIQALDDALSALSILKKCHFPGWDKAS